MPTAWATATAGNHCAAGTLCSNHCPWDVEGQKGMAGALHEWLWTVQKGQAGKEERVAVGMMPSSVWNMDQLQRAAMENQQWTGKMDKKIWVKIGVKPTRETSWLMFTTGHQIWGRMLMKCFYFSYRNIHTPGSDPNGGLQWLWHLLEMYAASYKQGRRLLECVEDNLLIQVMDSSTRGEVLPDLLFTNIDEIIRDAKIGVSLAWIDHSLIEFTVLRDMG